MVCCLVVSTYVRRLKAATTREPAPLRHFNRVQLGDVGYVREGCFHLLFSAGKPLGEGELLGVHVPPTFEQLNVGPIITRQPRLPGSLTLNTVRETRASLGASVSAAPYVYVVPFALLT